jgi:transcriptional regulator with XRE-family HTH domain
MAKAKRPSKPAFTPRAQTGTDLRAWRLLVGLLAREVADLIGVSERSVLRAERSARPTGKVLAGFERLQGLLLEGKLDIRPLLRRRWSRGTTKTQKRPLTGHSPRKTLGRNMTSGLKKPRQTGRSF